jgi:hypothetical protein
MKAHIAVGSIALSMWVGTLHGQSVKPYIAEGPPQAKTGDQRLPDASAAAIKQLYQRAKRLVLASADVMPEQDYTFRPTPKVMSFGEMVAHVAFVQIGDCAAAQGDTRLSPIDLTKLAREGTEESICEFSRAFDVRNTDTWVVRAVYEQIQEQLRWVQPDFPVRARDRLVEDRLLDPDDIDLDVFWCN